MKSGSKSASQSNVFESSASYYNPATKKWELGSFTLNKNHFQFICNSSRNEQFHLCLPLSTITGLEKRLSNFIYPSLVVCVGPEKHWFGSFTSRDAVYNLFELFWRESLISRPHRELSPKRNTLNSALGKDLLDILHESENTLIGTANALSDQSRQLYDVEQDVEDMNNDLVTAEEAIKSLSLPFVLPSFVNNNNVNTESDSRLQKYKVTFSFSNDESKIDWKQGILIISNELILLKVEESTVMQVTKDELEEIEILSPWELCIRHTFSGIKKPCYFMCPQLSRLLKFVSSIPHYHEKVAYTDDDSSLYETASSSSISSFGSAMNAPSSPCSHSNSENKLESVQTEVIAETLSADEIVELNSVLQNLQTLAVEVGREQENQMERINALMENMEKTEIKAKKNSENLKKMT